MMHPEYEILAEDEDGDASLHTGRIVPVYEAAGKVTTRALRTLLYRILESTAPMPDDPLPEHIRAQLKLPDRWSAIRELHFPGAEADLRVLNAFRSPAQYRLIFEEFFWLECGLELKRAKARLQPGIQFALTDRARERIKTMLPFRPTGAQKRVLAEIAHDMSEPHPMYRLLQGDVGSGKTLVAVEAAIIAIENAYQAAVLAPTGNPGHATLFLFQEAVPEIGLRHHPYDGLVHGSGEGAVEETGGGWVGARCGWNARPA